MSHQEAASYPDGDVLCLDRGDGSTALIHLFGATVLSWKCKGVENLYLSSLSIEQFNKKTPIRGGVPLVFPHFGPWEKGPLHGFARVKTWSVDSQPTKDNDNNVTVSLVLEDDEDTRAMWSYKFKLIYKLTLKESCLETEMLISNTGSDDFEFTSALHTYFKVSNIETTFVSGLKGLSYVDKLQNDAIKTEIRDLVKMDEGKESARVYQKAPSSVEIISEGTPARRVELSTRNFPDIVVWNPWVERSKIMPDLDDLGYLEFICVEAGNVCLPITVRAGDTFTCAQIFTDLS